MFSEFLIVNGTPCWGIILGRNLMRAAHLIQSGTTALPSPKIKINRKASVSVHVGGATWILPFHDSCTPMRSWESHCPSLCHFSHQKTWFTSLIPTGFVAVMGSVDHYFTIALAVKSGLSFSLCVLCSVHTGRTETWRNQSPAAGWRFCCGSQMPSCCSCWLRLYL